MTMRRQRNMSCSPGRGVYSDGILSCVRYRPLRIQVGKRSYGVPFARRISEVFTEGVVVVLSAMAKGEEGC